MFRLATTHPKSTALVGFVLPGILATVIEYVMTGGTTGVVPTIAALVAGAPTLAVLFFLGAFSDQPSTDLEPAASVAPFSNTAVASETGNRSISLDPRPEVVANRFFSPRTPAEMVAEQRGKTSIVAQGLGERHKGNWLKVEGTIRDVEDWYGDLKVTLDSSQSQPMVFLDFDLTEWKTRLKILDEGDRIVAFGEIEGVSARWLRLTNCELVKVLTDDAAIEESGTG